MKQEIIQGDCLEVMRGFADKQFDLVLTSPPYNLYFKHHTGNAYHEPYEDGIDEQEYQTKQIAILNELHRLTADTGSLLYNHKNRFVEGKMITPYEWLLKTDWIIKQEIVWQNGSQNFDKIRFYPMTERVYWLAKSPKTVLENKINAHDIFKWNAVGTGEQHKRAFPLEMAMELISCFPNGKVLDPFLGSGTTLVACKQLGRGGVGIEISPEYCEIARKRLEQSTLL